MSLKNGDANGNGNGQIRRAGRHGPGNGQIVPADGEAPAWVAKMREAAMRVLTIGDVETIVQNQVEAAKKGDRNAIKFVFEQILGGQQVKAATFIQNNYHGEETPSKPIEAPQGSEDRIRGMRRRAEAGMPIIADGDSREKLR